MSVLDLGIVGCGVMGRHHIEMAREHPGVRVAAVADVRVALAEALAREYGVPKVYPSGEALLRDGEIQAVVLALPTCWRTPLALEALARGKDVLIEKPIAMNADEVRRLIAARGRNVVGCCSSRPLFDPSAKAVATSVASGEIGRLRLVHARAMMPLRAKEPPPPAWRLKRDVNGGGILMNWGCYDLDFILGVTGWVLEPRTVFAVAWGVPDVYASWVAPGSDAETHFAALIKCAGGETIYLERAEYVPSAPADSVHLIGDRGSIHCRMVAPHQTVVIEKADPERGLLPETLWEGDCDGRARNMAMVRDFIEAVMERRQPQTSLERALVIQRISDAIYRSAESSMAISIEDV